MILRLLSIILSFFIISSTYTQDIKGEWYGWGNPNYLFNENNYMISMQLNEKNEQVDGFMTVYYMDKKITMPIFGVFDKKTKTLLISEVLIPMHFHNLKPLEKLDIDMYLNSKLINSRSGDQIKGNLISKTYKNLNNINFSLVKPYNEKITKLVEQEIPIESNDTPIKEETKRKILIKEEITVFSDTLDIDIYDGSIIDDDTVSVFYNEKIILDRSRISEKAINIKLVLSKHDITHLFVLRAENLGSIPPNTGVMIVRDGDNRHEVFFSNNLQLSTGIIFSKGAR